MPLATVGTPAITEMLTIVGEVAERYANSRRDTSKKTAGAPEITRSPKTARRLVTGYCKDSSKSRYASSSRGEVEPLVGRGVTFEFRKFEHKIGKNYNCMIAPCKDLLHELNALVTMSL